MSRSSSFVWACLLVACVEAPIDVPDAAARPDAQVVRRDAGPDAGPPADLDGYVEWQMAAGGIPGAAAAIVKDGAVVWTGTYGLADVESGRPVDDQTLFLVASISKTMVAVRALQLVEAGLLDLDAPLETYLPYAVRHPDYPDVAITTRMLLTHTGGLADNLIELGGASTEDDPTETLAGFAEGYVTPGGAYWGEGNWGAAPGTSRSYCNAAFGVLGDVLERAGGASFPAQTREHVFEAIDMDGAGWLLSEVDRARLATPYAYAGRGAYTALPPGGYAFYPATSLRVSVTGLSRFLAALARGGEVDGMRLLSEASVTELFRVQFPGISRGQALTFYSRTVNGQSYIGHSGSAAGNSAQMLLSAEGTHGIVLLTNSDAYLRSRLGLEEGDRAMEAILERLDEEARRM